MGTIFAPTYGTLSIGCLELTFYRVCINEFFSTLGHLILENCCRFLNDSKRPLDKTKTDPNRLLEILNSINPSVKFTVETSDKELLVLYIFIKRNDNKIWMHIYFKPTDTPMCLPFSSIHLNH